MAIQDRDYRPWDRYSKNIEPLKNDMFNIYISPAERGVHKEDVVTARIAENLVFNIVNQYGALFSAKDSAFGAAFQLGVGKSLALQKASKQIWKGSTQGTFSFEIELVAIKDPRTEVIDQIKSLYKMASPAASGKQSKTGVVGAAEKAWNSLLHPPGLINIDIPNVLSLTNVYLMSVNFTQVMKLMKSIKDGEPVDPARPMKANGQIEVVPEFMFVQEDIDFVFLGGS